jgi:hypothetical protein
MRVAKAKLAIEHRELLLNRWIEAADTLRRLPPVRYPKEFGNSFPEILHEWTWQERNEFEKEREKAEFIWGSTRQTPPSAGAISRLDQVTDWSLRYLMAWPAHRPCAPRQCLWAFAICSARDRARNGVKGANFSSVCKKRGWARRTAYDRIDQALLIVFEGLSTDGISAAPSAVDYSAQSAQISPHSQSSSGYVA